MMQPTSKYDALRVRRFFAGQLRRNISIMIYLFAAGAFFLPLQYIMEFFRSQDASAHAASRDFITSAPIYTPLSVVMISLLWLAASLTISLLQLSYMHNRSACDMLHGLPLTRRQLLYSNVLAAYLTVAIPMCADYLITAAAALILRPSGAYALTAGAFFADLLGWLSVSLGITAVVAVVSTQASSGFDSFIFSCELLAAGPVLVGCWHLLCETFVLGWGERLYFRDIAILSPLLLRIGLYIDGGDHARYYTVLALIWLALSVLLLLLAGRLYLRRPTERAGSTGSAGLLALIFKAVAVLIGSCVIGLLVYNFSSNSETAYLIGSVVGALLTCALVDAVVNRGFRGLGRHLPANLAICGAAAAAAVGMVLGGFGLESLIPQPSQVSSVVICYDGPYSGIEQMDIETEWKALTGNQYNGEQYMYGYYGSEGVELASDEGIAVAEQLHRQFIADARDSAAGAENSYISFTVEYRLSGGRSIRRVYQSASEKTAGMLLLLEDTPEYRSQTDPVYSLKASDLNRLVITDANGFDPCVVTDRAQIAAILSALRSDHDRMKSEQLRGGELKASGYIWFDTGISDSYSGANLYRPLEEDSWASFSLPVFTGFSATRAACESAAGDQVFVSDVADISGMLIMGYPYDYSTVASEQYFISGIAAEQMEEMYGAPEDYADASTSDASEIADLLPVLKTTGFMFGDDSANAYYVMLLDKDGVPGVTLIGLPADTPASLLEGLLGRMSDIYDWAGNGALSK